MFGGVYKLVAYEDDEGNVVPKIKLSENVSKITTPQYKRVYRLFGNETGKAIGDWLCTYDEDVKSNCNPDGSLTIFDPDATWKKKTINNFTAKELRSRSLWGGGWFMTCPLWRRFSSTARTRWRPCGMR